MSDKSVRVPGSRLGGTLLAAAILALGAISGCGSSSTGTPVASRPAAASVAAPASVAGPTSAAGPTSVAAPISVAVPTSVAGQSKSASVSAGDECGGAVERVKKATTSFKEITTITMVAGCGEVSIATNLAAGVLGSPSATAGVMICNAAAAVAYQGDVSSVTVVATDGHELAIAVKGQDCIP